MPTTITWGGGTSGDVNVAANWSPIQVPINGDSIIVDGQTTQNMNASLDTFAAMKFALFFVGPDATIGIGTAATDGNALKFAATRLVNQGAGTFYYELADVATNTTDELIVNSPNRELAMGVFVPGEATCVSAVFTNGRVTFAGTILNLTDVFVSFRSAAASDVIVSFDDSVAFIANLHMGGGIVSAGESITNAYCGGGEITFNPGGGATRLYIAGGNVIYKHTSTLALAELRSGSLDLVQRSRNMTITTLRRWPNTTLKTNELVTIATTEDMTGGDI